MKKNFKLLASTALLSIAVTGLVACNNDAPAPIIKKVASVALNDSEKTIGFGSTYKLVPTFPDGIRKTVTWASTNSRVVEVDQNGLVKANGLGTAIVFAQTEEGSARCTFNVNYGTSIPSLTINHIFGDELVLTKGQEFSIDGQIAYNSSLYEADLEGYDYDTNVISFEGNVVTALSVGETTINLEAKWNDFDATFLSKTIRVRVVNDVEFYTNVTLGNSTKVTNHFTLYTMATWGNQAYQTNAILAPQIYVQGVYHAASFAIEQNNTLNVLGNSIVANNPGTNLITVFYNDGQTTYSTKITVDVVVPETKYLGGKITYCLEDRFPLTDFFDVDATLLHVYQGGKELTVENGVFVDLIADGDDTLPITVVTNRGSYYFEEIYAYNKALTKENIFDTLHVGGNKIIKGFYTLQEDILDLDMTNQDDGSISPGTNNNYIGTFFAGTIDAQLHTIKATVGANGFFGGLGDGAIIKNARFDFTFAGDGVASGLAKNGGGFVYYSVPKVSIINTYITTTNYRENTYAISEYRNPHLVLKDVYVKLGGTEALPLFTDASLTEEAALFRVDKTTITGPSTFYTGDFVNVHVVTGKFIPLGNGRVNENGVDWTYLNYGRNDVSYFGQEGVVWSHYVPRNNESGYSVLVPTDTVSPSDPHLKLFGRGNHWQIESEMHKKYARLYMSTLTNGGIFRYDYSSQITVDKIGDWSVR